jgi:hypothetical protein
MVTRGVCPHCDGDCDCDCEWDCEWDSECDCDAGGIYVPAAATAA